MLYPQMALELSGGVEARWTVAAHGPRPTDRVRAYDGLVRVRVRVGVRLGLGLGLGLGLWFGLGFRFAFWFGLG